MLESQESNIMEAMSQGPEAGLEGSNQKARAIQGQGREKQSGHHSPSAIA